VSLLDTRHVSTCEILRKRQTAHTTTLIASPRRTCPISEKGLEMNNCRHLDQIQPVTPHTNGCEECLKSGDDWVHLRLCLTCGHVGCCDSSKNKHATKHFHRSQHPLVRSLEPGEEWGWCYVDQMMLQSV
jgi:uncharacterized UBP type Zn finger protein